MFHSFDYPDETGKNKLASNFWDPLVRDGIVDFNRAYARRMKKEICATMPNRFEMDVNLKYVEGKEQDYAESIGGLA